MERVRGARTPNFNPALRHFSVRKTADRPTYAFSRRPSLFDRLATLRHLRFRRHNGSTSPNPTPNLGSPQPALSVSQRLRKLSREYGWSALGVYLLLSALDFPFCFLAVRILGTDRIGHWEHIVINWFWSVVPWKFTPTEGQDQDRDGQPDVVDGAMTRVGEGGWGVEAAEQANTESGASIWTQLALAYAIHKSFIFLRVPLTAAVTPKVVHVLRRWGWDIGKRKPKVSPVTKT
ncbi:MAG: hypothetical protein M1838_003818 [Thelocarpon superellum]|nr:MAG: hypothetical protein M1838_003818 [Thelocarpon superellum]